MLESYVQNIVCFVNANLWVIIELNVEGVYPVG